MRVYTTIEQVRQLEVSLRSTVIESWLDMMGHLNVRYYMGLFDDAGWNLFDKLGLDAAYYKTDQGSFELRSYITYIAEVRLGESVAVHVRMLAYNASRIHMIYFLVNETTGKLAATMEVVDAHADLKARKITPFPAAIYDKIRALAQQHQDLDWEAPVCGIMGV